MGCINDRKSLLLHILVQISTAYTKKVPIHLKKVIVCILCGANIYFHGLLYIAKYKQL